MPQPSFCFLMNKRELFRFFCVPRCPSCRAFLARGEWVLCNTCREIYQEEKIRNCSVCFQTLPECKCSIPHLEQHRVKELVKITRYRPDNLHCPSAYLIYSLKQDFRRDVYTFLAEELSALLEKQYTEAADFIFTNVPRRHRALVEYGYDHARILAGHVARRLGGEYRATLISKAKTPQKQLSDEERLQNAKFYPKKKIDLEGKCVVLIDDIVTTGASMGECADLLYTMGAKTVIGACISIAYSDPYVPIISSDDYTRW